MMHVINLVPAIRTVPVLHRRWEEEIEGVKQACWCGEEWCDNHEDGNHEDVYIEMPVLGKRKTELDQMEKGLLQFSDCTT